MKLNKIFALPAIMLAFAGFTACTDEVEYEPAQPESTAEVFFSSATATTVSLDLDQNTVNVPIYRANTNGAVTVAIASAATVDGNPVNIFSVPASVTFADQSDVAQVPVQFNFASIEANKNYLLTLTIEDAATTEYGKRTETFTIKYAPWTAWKSLKEPGEYTIGANPNYAGEYSPKLETRTNLLNGDLVEYRLPDFFNEPIIIDLDKSTNYVRIPVQSTGLAYSGGGNIYLADSYTFVTEIYNKQMEKPIDPATKETLSTFDPETGMMTLNVMYFVLNNGEYLGGWGFGEDFLQLPGYPDYNLYFANNGTAIPEGSDVENAIITVAKGADVNGYALKMVEGYLSDEDCATIADELEANSNAEIFYEGANFHFPMTKGGYYTLVSVNYNEKGIRVGSSNFRFYYEKQQIDWNEGWESLGDAKYTDYFVFTTPLTWEVELQESKSTPGYYRLVKPYATCPAVSPEDVERGHFYIEIDATNPHQVYIPLSNTSLGYGVMSMPYYHMEIEGATEEDVTEMGLWGKLSDGAFTFPAGSLALVVGNRIMLTNEEEVTMLELPNNGSQETPGEELSTRPATAPALMTTAPLKTINKPVFKSVTGKRVESKGINTTISNRIKAKNF